MSIKNWIHLHIFGEYYDIIPNTRVCGEMHLRHGYDLSKHEQIVEGYRSAWFDIRGNKYKCKYLLSEPIDSHGRLINHY